MFAEEEKTEETAGTEERGPETAAATEENQTPADPAAPAAGGAAEPPVEPEIVAEPAADAAKTAAETATGATTDAPAGEAADGAAPEPDPALAAALAEVALWKDRAARLQADFDNYRKRQAREREDTIRQANADLLEELLPVLDQTDTAIAAVSKDAAEASKPFLEGFELVRRTFLNAVAKFGLKPVESPVGKPLDPATSEALSVMKTGQAEPGCVVFESRKGYTLGGKLLRASQVVVEQED